MRKTDERGRAMSENTITDTIWADWLATVMSIRPNNNDYLDSARGTEVTKLCLDIEREDFNWHRSDTNTFWLDIQMFVKYKLDNDEIRFICKQQPGVDNHSKHSKERNAYAEMKRGLDKLKTLVVEREQLDKLEAEL